MQLKELKNQFLEHLEIEKNRSLRTIVNYDHYLTRFLETTRLTNPSDITDESVRTFRLYLNRHRDEAGHPLKKITQNYHIIALRAFLKYLAKRGVKSLAAERIELGKQEERQVTFLEANELDRLMDGPKGDSITALRDRAILEMLFSTGLRVSELVSLKRDEIDLERGEFSVRGKGSKVRLVFVSDRARQSLQKYIDARTDTDPALFIRIPKNENFAAFAELQLTTRSVQRILQKYAVVAGIVGKKVSPHQLRHSFATDLLRNGADIRSVQALLGHSSVTTTQIYTHVSDAHLKEVHERFHGRKK